MTYKFPEGWREVKLGEVTKKIGSGSTPRGGSKVYINEGISFIRSQNVLDFSFSLDGLVNIDDDAATKLDNVEVISNDILINITGDSVARACLVPDLILPARVNQHVSIIRSDETLSYFKYIYYQLHALKSQLLSYASSGATRKALTKSMLENLKIDLPSLLEQKAIADTLSSLDDKIELNNKINENLEQQAQAIFKHWFIDFEFPDENENPYKSSGGEMVESELGMIPKGWEISRLDDFIDFKEGPGIRHWQYTDEGIKFLNIRCIKNNDLMLDTANKISEEEANGKYEHFLLKEWDIVMSTSGTLGRYAIVIEEHLPLCLNTSIIGFRTKLSFEDYSYVYGYLTSEEFYNHLISKASGSVQLNFGPTHLRKIYMVIPDNYNRKRYNELVFPTIKMIIDNRNQNQKLKQLKDTLLPKLMSGEIRIPLDQ